ncbi:SDR family oxidoreductase [uncultured Umboniibacter sp.]|uniref:SDR family oxidoreductase n=1 Tax=uncultured Umboniibacter sp. TaxID=1798917 RepID=UPI00260734EE|nr:SDR family oxidoreductase [uncultured Umboniibacter sp.]
MIKRILITGSEGYVGKRLVARLSKDYDVFGIDLAPDASHNYHYQQMDIRSEQLAERLKTWGITHIIHLASIVSPSADEARDYDIDVNGTRNLVECALIGGVAHFTVTSSGAAYGYHADNPEWLSETDPLRGNDSFSYSRHKRLVEELLSGFRNSNPELQQLILRPGTVLGEATDNLITRLFQRSRILAVRGSSSPFVFIWDEDLVNIIIHGIEGDISGVFNVAGTGAVSIREVAKILGKPLLDIPAGVLRFLLSIGRILRLTPYGPEQLDFLRYRPVLDNKKLIEKFPYTPSKSSRETFDFYLAAQRAKDD